MSNPRLFDRALVRLSPTAPGEDVAAFLQGLVTNDVQGPLPVWAGLLTPQGKALFDFLVWPDGKDALLLDCEAAAAEALVKRLSLYRLRRKIAIAIAPELGVFGRATRAMVAPPIRASPRSASAGSAASDDDVPSMRMAAHRLKLG
jgi:folate-binding Fe-S cluster repair protein YgfZ